MAVRHRVYLKPHGAGARKLGIIETQHGLTEQLHAATAKLIEIEWQAALDPGSLAIVCELPEHGEVLWVFPVEREQPRVKIGYETDC